MNDRDILAIRNLDRARRDLAVATSARKESKMWMDNVDAVLRQDAEAEKKAEATIRLRRDKIESLRALRHAGFILLILSNIVGCITMACLGSAFAFTVFFVLVFTNLPGLAATAPDWWLRP